MFNHKAAVFTYLQLRINIQPSITSKHPNCSQRSTMWHTYNCALVLTISNFPNLQAVHKVPLLLPSFLKSSRHLKSIFHFGICMQNWCSRNVEALAVSREVLSAPPPHFPAKNQEKMAPVKAAQAIHCVTLTRQHLKDTSCFHFPHTLEIARSGKNGKTTCST